VRGAIIASASPGRQGHGTWVASTTPCSPCNAEDPREYSSPTSPLAWVNGSDAPEKSSLNIGFMALSDCASVVVAATQGFAQQQGLTLNLQRQASWAGLRDRLVSGELDAAHCLYGLVYAVQLGMGGGPASDMAVLMGLNQNAQAINLSAALQRKGVTNPEALARLAHQGGARLTFAQTFPTGTHAMWLYYWLASQGIHPLQDVNSVVVPPAQMVAHLQAGRIDGFWSASRGPPPSPKARASPWPPASRSGRTTGKGPPARAFRRAIPQQRTRADQGDPPPAASSKQPENRRGAAQLLSGSAYWTPRQDSTHACWAITDGLGNQWQDPHALRLFDQGWPTCLPVRRHVVHDPVPPLGHPARDPDYLGVAASPATGVRLRGRDAWACLRHLPMRSSLLTTAALGRQRSAATRAASACMPWDAAPDARVGAGGGRTCCASC
jgi:nitrate/nitrite transport system substrate-binding protein